MKYAGSMMIVDDDGNVAYDRDLTPDEMIGYLIEAQANLAVTEPETAEVPITPEPLRHSRVEKGKKGAHHCGQCGQPGHSRRTCGREIEAADEEGFRDCCRSMAGGYHKKGCAEVAAKKGKEGRRTVDNRHPFSETTYDVVKTMLDKDGSGVDGISHEKGLDLEEVRRCNLADDYEEYLAIA